MTDKDKRQLMSKIEDILLDFANIAQHGDVCDSDLQAIATVEAVKIVGLLDKVS